MKKIIVASLSLLLLTACSSVNTDNSVIETSVTEEKISVTSNLEVNSVPDELSISNEYDQQTTEFDEQKIVHNAMLAAAFKKRMVSCVRI